MCHLYLPGTFPGTQFRLCRPESPGHFFSIPIWCNLMNKINQKKLQNSIETKVRDSEKMDLLNNRESEATVISKKQISLKVQLMSVVLVSGNYIYSVI